jgi:hypothetical protein
MTLSVSATQVIEAAQQAAVGRRAFRFVLQSGIILIALLGFMYLMLLNSIATRGFDLQELKTVRMALQQDLEQSDIRLAIPSSLYALGASEQVQEMETVNRRHFIDARDTALAMALSEGVMMN